MSLDLLEIREKITHIDNQLLKLLSERHQLAYDIVKIKEKTQKPVRDIQREQASLQSLINLSNSENYQLDPRYITKIFQSIMEDSIQAQQHYLQNKLNKINKDSLTIAFLDIAEFDLQFASKPFLQGYQGELVELCCQSFEDVIHCVKSEKADYGILSLENSVSGAINDVYDLLQQADLYIAGEWYDENGTQFIVLAKAPIKTSPLIQTKLLLQIKMPQQAVKFSDIFAIFEKYQIAIIKTISSKEDNIVYFELKANIHHQETKQALEELKNIAQNINILGCYPIQIVELIK